MTGARESGRHPASHVETRAGWRAPSLRQKTGDPADNLTDRGGTGTTAMTYTIYDFIGNIGLFLLLGTYFLLLLNKIESRSVLYSLSNAAASTLIGISLLVDFNLSAFLVEVFWLAISLFGIGKWCYLRRKATPPAH